MSDLVALRARWREIAFTRLDEKSRRISHYCCFANIGRDLVRYPRDLRLLALSELFDNDFNAVSADEAEYILWDAGPDAAAAYVEEKLGVSLV